MVYTFRIEVSHRSSIAIATPSELACLALRLRGHYKMAQPVDQEGGLTHAGRLAALWCTDTA